MVVGVLGAIDSAEEEETSNPRLFAGDGSDEAVFGGDAFHGEGVDGVPQPIWAQISTCDNGPDSLGGVVVSDSLGGAGAADSLGGAGAADSLGGAGGAWSDGRGAGCSEHLSPSGEVSLVDTPSLTNSENHCLHNSLVASSPPAICCKIRSRSFLLKPLAWAHLALHASACWLALARVSHV